MAPSSTVYLVIPKGKASRIISAETSKLKAYERKDDVIKFGYTTSGSQKKASEWWMVSLYDYEFTEEKIKTPSGSFEKGILGTRMKYRKNDSHTKNAKNSVSEYIETG